jgi:hypothetical protein
MTPKQAYTIGQWLGMQKRAHFPGDPDWPQQGGQAATPAAPPAGGPTPAERNYMGFPSSRRGARLRRMYGMGAEVAAPAEAPAPSNFVPAPSNAIPATAASPVQAPPLAAATSGGPTPAELNRMGFPSSRAGARLRRKYGEQSAAPAVAAPAAAAPDIAAAPATAAPAATAQPRESLRDRWRRSRRSMAQHRQARGIQTPQTWMNTGR